MSFWRSLFARKKNAPGLHFKSPDDALAFACENLKSDWTQDAILPCIVVDTLGDIAAVHVASKDGPKKGLAGFLTERPSPGSYVGTLCAVMIGPEKQDAPRPLLLVARLATTYSAERGWVVAENFR